MLAFSLKFATLLQNQKQVFKCTKKAKDQNKMEISTQLNIPLVLEVEKETDTEIGQHFICNECDFVSEKDRI